MIGSRAARSGRTLREEACWLLDISVDPSKPSNFEEDYRQLVLAAFDFPAPRDTVDELLFDRRRESFREELKELASGFC